MIDLEKEKNGLEKEKTKIIIDLMMMQINRSCLNDIMIELSNQILEIRNSQIELSKKINDIGHEIFQSYVERGNLEKEETEISEIEAARRVKEAGKIEEVFLRRVKKMEMMRQEL